MVIDGAWREIIRAFQCVLLIVSVTSGPLLASAAAAPSEEQNCRLCFFGPDNMVFARDGTGFIVDTDHDKHFRVLKVSPSGKELGSWDGFSHSSTPGGGPEGIALDVSGNILVTEGAQNRVFKLSPSAKLLTTIRSPAFDGLGHVATTSAGIIYVGEAQHNRIQRLDSAGRMLPAWSRPVGDGRDEWHMPQSLAAMQDGSLVVEDWANRRIMVLTAMGKTSAIFGSVGVGPSQFKNTAGIAVDGGDNIYVADTALHRVQKFDRGGKLIATFANTTDSLLFLEGPTSVAIDTRGDIYSADGLSIVKFSQRGRLLQRWR